MWFCVFFKFISKIFVAFVIASVFGAPAPAPAPAPKPHYVSAVPYGYSGYSPYASPYIASPYVSYASPYSYGYSPLGKFWSQFHSNGNFNIFNLVGVGAYGPGIGAYGAYGGYGAYGAYPYAFY